MEDLEAAPGSPALQDGEEPQGNNDPGDTLNPGVEEEDTGRTPPIADPQADTEAFEDDQAPETTDAMRDEEDGIPGPDPDDDDDDESELEELDEKEFEDFDPSALNIPDKPVQVDADNVGLLGVHKRKRTEEEERQRKKKKEGRRDKPKRRRVRAGDDEDVDVDSRDIVEGRRERKSKGGAEGRQAKAPKRAKTPEDDESLTPEERRRRALDRKMDEALKTNRSNRRRGGASLDDMADEEINTMRQRMAKACELDAEARAKGEVATHKLAILPQVVELLNRNTIQAQLVDPDSNILEAVRFMLEPADHDAALPNYQIQRELFSSLSHMNIGKEALVASGIGKVVLFYTKSVQPQGDIKRMAEKLIGEWMRVVLKKPVNKTSRNVETKSYDPVAASQQQAAAARNAGLQLTPAEKEERRRKALAMPIPGNRARIEGGLGTYNIAPVNNLSNMGLAKRNRTGGEEAFRRIAARSAAAAAKAKR